MASKATRLHLDPERIEKCVSGKIAYDSHEAAWTAAEQAMEKALVWPGCHLTPYACHDCGAWHVRNRRIVTV